MPRLPLPKPAQTPPPPPDSSKKSHSSATGKTPADRALEAEGGAIIPDFNEVRPTVEGKPADAPAHTVDLTAGVLSPGNVLPPGAVAADVPADVAQFQASVSSHVNAELNILNACYAMTRNFVAVQLRNQPPDSAELGESMFGPGKRTPLEMAEPEIALEVYRQVRLNMREEERQDQDEQFRALKVLLGKVGK